MEIFCGARHRYKGNEKNNSKIVIRGNKYDS